PGPVCAENLNANVMMVEMLNDKVDELIAREPGGPLQPIEDAPGSYVRVRHSGAGHQGNTHSVAPSFFA
ncbi:MAG: hypothetical protein WB803_24455, partial [Pseudolabrys sp.]